MVVRGNKQPFKHTNLYNNFLKNLFYFKETNIKKVAYLAKNNKLYYILSIYCVYTKYIEIVLCSTKKTNCLPLR